jgi:hypothetical protein
MNYMSGKAAVRVMRFRTGRRRSGRFGKMNQINKQALAAESTLSKE